MLKIESYPTSGHTSDDGVEVITNTSSDIEIISSPVLSEHGRFKANNQKLIQSKINSSPSKDGNAMKRKIRGEFMVMKKNLTFNITFLYLKDECEKVVEIIDDDIMYNLYEIFEIPPAAEGTFCETKLHKF